MSEINDVDDLNGMLPDEIVAVVQRLEATNQRLWNDLSMSERRVRYWSQDNTLLRALLKAAIPSLHRHAHVPTQPDDIAQCTDEVCRQAIGLAAEPRASAAGTAPTHTFVPCCENHESACEWTSPDGIRCSGDRDDPSHTAAGSSGDAEAFAQSVEAVGHLLELYNPDGLDDPGPGIANDLKAWRALLSQEPVSHLVDAEAVRRAAFRFVAHMDAQTHERLTLEDSLTTHYSDGEVILCHGCDVELYAHARPDQPHKPDCLWLEIVAMYRETVGRGGGEV